MYQYFQGCSGEVFSETNVKCDITVIHVHVQAQIFAGLVPDHERVVIIKL